MLSNPALFAVALVVEVFSSAASTHPNPRLFVSAIFAFVGTRLDFSKCVQLKYIRVLASGASPL